MQDRISDIHGTFEVFDAANPPQLTLPHIPAQAKHLSTNPIQTAHMAMVVGLGRILVGKEIPAIDINPTPADFGAVNDYVLKVCAVLDAWLLEVGNDVNRNVTHNIDMKQFKRTFTDACEGMATFEIDRCGEIMLDEIEEAVGYGRTAGSAINTIRRERGL